MVAKILIILSAFVVYIIAAPHSTHQDIGGGDYAAIRAEDIELISPSYLGREAH
ncbi:hypothetical protein F4604DRAFT_1918130 [Suillus subluteus]|nr:hypothetical protein F4604DRAFT_1918130 [Suillus subluteus]